MKKIGLLGGMSWESSVIYYEILNRKVRERLGGFHSANCVLESVDFAEIEKYQKLNNWNKLNKLMAKAAKNLENAGAQLIILCQTRCICVQKVLKMKYLYLFFILLRQLEIASKKRKLKKFYYLEQSLQWRKIFTNKHLKKSLILKL